MVLKMDSLPGLECRYTCTVGFWYREKAHDRLLNPCSPGVANLGIPRRLGMSSKTRVFQGVAEQCVVSACIFSIDAGI